MSNAVQAAESAVEAARTLKEAQKRPRNSFSEALSSVQSSLDMQFRMIIRTIGVVLHSLSKLG